MDPKKNETRIWKKEGSVLKSILFYVQTALEAAENQELNFGFDGMVSILTFWLH